MYVPPQPTVKAPPAGRYRLLITAAEYTESAEKKYPMIKIGLQIIEPDEVTFEGEQVQASGYTLSWYPTFIEKFDDRINNKLGNLFAAMWAIGVDQTKLKGDDIRDYVKSVAEQVVALKGYAFWSLLDAEPIYKKAQQTAEQRDARLKPADEIDPVTGKKIVVGHTLRVNIDKIEPGSVKVRDIAF